ncbi:hypothetical protein [Anaeromicropila populeti]|uniref:Uncharacterized protein n=1 Tax=Anaeromicropila populeti TaxID=37658 RepID=A0A1I6KME8_9FIRM|nr:hypothetical protein [Anaeromicropila populeti]SFR92386.1 hypothetical protein SAMN05661086_02543 [Anaeromicropila populeti]
MEIDEQIIEMKKLQKKEQYHSIYTGMYIKDEVIHFSPIHLFRDKIKIYSPDQFIDMPLSVAKFKYPSEQRPEIIKTSLDTATNMAFNLLNIPLKPNETKNMTAQYKTIFKNMNPSYQFFDEAVENIGNTTVSWFDFKSYAMDDQLYNLLFITTAAGMTLHGIFNCVFGDYAEWKEAFHQMMMSVEDLTERKG